MLSAASSSARYIRDVPIYIRTLYVYIQTEVDLNGGAPRGFLLFYEPVTTEKTEKKISLQTGWEIFSSATAAVAATTRSAGTRGKCTVAPKREIYDVTAFAEGVRV